MPLQNNRALLVKVQTMLERERAGLCPECGSPMADHRNDKQWHSCKLAWCTNPKCLWKIWARNPKAYSGDDYKTRQMQRQMRDPFGK